jgi:hypothetical protein
MDRLPSSDDALQGFPECADARSSHGHAVGPADRILESTALRGRSDIDMAMVEALRHAMDIDGALRSAPWVGSPASLSRSDIDTAMVEALRLAMAGDPPARHA